MIYLDHAATSFPKPAEVIGAVAEALAGPYGNPGRSAHQMAMAASRLIFDARESLSEYLGVADSSRLIFTAGATDALNLAIWGTLERWADGEVVISGYEHNAVWRPLQRWAKERRGVIRVVPPGFAGPLDLAAWQQSLGPATRLAVLTWASNVSGEVLPVVEAAAMCRERGIPCLVDAAQAAGYLTIPWDSVPADMIATSGHKGLEGPSGVGLLYAAGPLLPSPTRLGGTGGNSEDPEPPTVFPDRLEAGTPNLPGIAGLGAAARVGLLRNSAREKQGVWGDWLREELGAIPGVTVAGQSKNAEHVGVVSFTIDQMPPQVVAARLEEEFDILCRAGLHCAPLAHRTLHTGSLGTVRFSLGHHTTEEDLHRAVEAVGALAAVALYS